MMKEADRSKEEFIAELHALRRWLAELETDAALSGQEVPPLDAAEGQRAEEALRESEAKNRALVRTIPDALFRMSREGIYLDFIPAEGFETLLPLKHSWEDLSTRSCLLRLLRRRYIVLFAKVRNEDEDKLVVARYNLATWLWDGEPIELDLLDEVTDFTAVVNQQRRIMAGKEPILPMVVV